MCEFWLWRADRDVVNLNVTVFYGCCSNLTLGAMLGLSQSRLYALEQAVLMSNTRIHQSLQLPCLVLGPMILLFIVLWRWDNINFYFHLLSRATCNVKAVVVSIIMKVSGQPRKRAVFWHMWDIWCWLQREYRGKNPQQSLCGFKSSLLFTGWVSSGR